MTIGATRLLNVTGNITKGTESAAVNLDLGLADIYSRLTVQVWRQWGGGGGGVSHPGTSQRLGRSDLPLQGRNLLAWSADTPCTHHAPDTHGLVEGHVRAHTLRQYLFIIYYSNV